MTDFIKILKPIVGCSEDKIREVLSSYNGQRVVFEQNEHHNHIVPGTRVVVYPVKIAGNRDKIPVIIGLQKECPVSKETYKFKSIIKTTSKSPEIKKVMEKYNIPFISEESLDGCINECVNDLLELL